MRRNYLFMRSVTFSLAAKSLGFFVVFTCLPLAALSLNSLEYATFNYSMSVAGLFSVVFGPPSLLLVGNFARLSARGDKVGLKALAEVSISLFIWLALLISPFAICVAAYLSPPEFRSSVVLATVAVVGANVLSWADVFRLGLRKDHVSSGFALGNNITIISGFLILYHNGRLSYATVMLVYYLCPFVWGAASLTQLMLANGYRVRLVAPIEECKGILVDSLPLVNGTLADYVRLHVSSLVAFNLFTPSDYNVYSTVTLLIARVLNPVTLLSRPLIPAYIDAVALRDFKWLGRLRRGMAVLGGLLLIAVIGSPILLLIIGTKGFSLGAIQLNHPEIVFYLIIGALLAAAQIYTAFLASIFLGAHRMATFSNANLAANVIGLIAGVAAFPFFGPNSLFACLSICNAICAVCLAWLFLSDPFHLDTVGKPSVGSGAAEG